MKPKKKITSQKLIKRIIIIISCLTATLLIIAPTIIIYNVVNGHINYLGYTTEDHPLQDIYKPDDFGLNTTEQYLTTNDGLSIWTSEIFVENPKAVVIYLSGIQQPSVTYFYGHSRWLCNNGYASILLEARGHGQSEGNQVCLGYKEVADVQATVDYIKSQNKYNDVPIFIHGVSMGGAIAVNAFGQIPDIDGLIAMSAYSSFEEVVYETMLNYKIPKFLCMLEKPLIKLNLNLFFGQAAEELSPINQVKNIGDRPAFFIASTGDTEVPPENMNRLLKAAPEHCERWLKDSWEHFIVNDCDFANMEQDTEYCDRIMNFMEKAVNEIKTTD